MEIAEFIGAAVGGATLLGFLLKGTNSLTRIELTLSNQVKENEENKNFRHTADKTLNDHSHRISRLETDVSELQDEGG